MLIIARGHLLAESKKSKVKSKRPHPAPFAGNDDSLSPDWTLPTVHSMISHDTVAREEPVLLGPPPPESGPHAGEGDEEMKEENESHLQSIMQKFKQKLAKSKDAKEQQQSEADAFYLEFKRVRTEVIRPAMEDIGNQLKTMGHTVEISEIGDERAKRDAKITLRVTIGGVPSSAYTPENTVLVSFSHTGRTTVSIHASTPSQHRSEFAGARGNYALSEITTDLVEKKILEVLEEVFSRGSQRG